MSDRGQIAIGCDHAGPEIKSRIIEFLKREGFEVTNYGTDSSESVDYPDFGHEVAVHVADNDCLGILICGSGNGINMTANKHEDVRSALCWTEEIAALARQHNDANILALPARFINEEMAMKIVKVFIETSFEGGRHAKRVQKINC